MYFFMQPPPIPTTVRIVMGGATAGEITVKRSRPVEKYRQIYYMTYYHKNQDVIFNISQKSKNHH